MQAASHSKCGTFTEIDFDGNEHTFAAERCVHCGYCWVVRPGSGKRRGYCWSCHGYVCGHAACLALGCVPIEQWLENIEAGRREDYRRVLVSPGGVILRT